MKKVVEKNYPSECVFLDGDSRCHRLKKRCTTAISFLCKAFVNEKKIEPSGVNETKDPRYCAECLFFSKEGWCYKRHDRSFYFDANTCEYYRKTN